MNQKVLKFQNIHEFEKRSEIYKISWIGTFVHEFRNVHNFLKVHELEHWFVHLKKVDKIWTSSCIWKVHKNWENNIWKTSAFEKFTRNEKKLWIWIKFMHSEKVHGIENFTH